MANIVITGANQGIGYFLAEQLLNDGNRVAVFDLETENLEKYPCQTSTTINEIGAVALCVVQWYSRSTAKVG